MVFSPDEWILSLFGADFPVARFGEVGDAVKELIWHSAARVLAVEARDVVLDFSFWAREGASGVLNLAPICSIFAVTYFL